MTHEAGVSDDCTGRKDVTCERRAFWAGGEFKVRKPAARMGIAQGR